MVSRGSNGRVFEIKEKTAIEWAECAKSEKQKQCSWATHQGTMTQHESGGHKQKSMKVTDIFILSVLAGT